MSGPLDAVDHRIAHIEIGRSHVDFGAERFGTVGEFPCFHAAEEIEILFHAAVAVRTFLAGFFQRAAVGADLFGVKVADISQPFFNELFRQLIKAGKIIRSVEHIVPFKAQPGDVFFDGIDIFHIFFAGVGIIKTQVAYAVVLFGHAEIHADGFGVTQMEIAVGLRRKTGLHLVENAVFKVFFNKMFDEIFRFSYFRFFFGGRSICVIHYSLPVSISCIKWS